MRTQDNAVLTKRQEIIQYLERHTTDVRNMARDLGMRVDDVVQHLGHIRKSLGKKLIVSEAECLVCGFCVDRSDRFTAPSRCPKCKSERFGGPVVTIK